MYPNAYGADCESGSTQPYGMPNFGSLAKDPLLPQRCQDPTQMQVSNLMPCLSQLALQSLFWIKLTSTPHLCEGPGAEF